MSVTGYHHLLLLFYRQSHREINYCFSQMVNDDLRVCVDCAHKHFGWCTTT